MALHVFAWTIAGAFVVGAVFLSLQLIADHIRAYERPELQRHVVRILLMCPVYAIDSWIGLRYAALAEYTSVIRDTYEAVTIYSFLKLLFEFLGGEEAAAAALSSLPPVRLLFPLHRLRPWQMGNELLLNCKYGSLQYVIIKPLCAVIVFVAGSLGVYGPGELRLDRAWVYVFVASNVSQVWAMYCLLMFYFAAKDRLAPWRPVPKLLSVKTVVFFTFWQGIVLAALEKVAVIRSTRRMSAAEVATVMQNLLVCCEMFAVAIFHKYAFPVAEFGAQAMEEAPAAAGGEGGGYWDRVKHSLAVGDVLQDVRDLEEAALKRPLLKYGTFVGVKAPTD